MIVKDIDKISPWFAVTGDLALSSWDKLGRDLEQAKQEERIGRGTFPLWRLVRNCLKEGRNTEILKEGRKALQKHQDSLSESDHKEEDKDRPKRKKEKSKEKDPEIVTKEKGKKNPISLVLEEFINLDLSEEELDPQEEEDLEEAAARY